MKLKHIALAALVAASGFANAAVIDNGAAAADAPNGNGGLFFSIWDASGSYSRNLNIREDAFSAQAAAGSLGLVYSADATFQSFLATADLATLQWNIVGNDFTGVRRIVETYSTLPATTIKNDLARSTATGIASFVTKLNTQLASSDSTTFAAGTPGYAGNAATFGAKSANGLNFFNTGTLANDSSANGLNMLMITASATGIASSIYAPYAGVTAYIDSSNALHIAAVTAVPEPESYAMLLAGLGLMGAVARRRNKKSA